MMRNKLENVHNVAGSSRTVARLDAAPLLTRENIVAWLHLTRNHQNWSVDYYKNVLTNESRVSRNDCLDGRELVWRRPGVCYLQYLCSDFVRWWSVMFWSGICFETLIELVLARRRSMNSDYYLDNIIIEYKKIVESNFLFMQDNARPRVS